MSKRIEPQIAFIIIMFIIVGFLWFISTQSYNVNEELNRIENKMDKTRKVAIIGLDDKKELKDFNIGSTSDELVKTVGWNIYENEKYGYRLMYPSDWKFVESASKKSVIFTSSEDEYEKYGNRGSLNIHRERELNINDYIKNYELYENYSEINDALEIISISNIKLNFLDAKRILFGKDNELKKEVTFIEGKNQNAFILTREESMRNKKYINTIISTFKVD